MLFFDGLLCSRIGQNQCCTKCVWYCNALFQTAHFWNKFQMKLFLFQWLGPVFLSSSYPKIGISSNRSNLHISLFLRFAPVLWIIDKHCNKIIKPARNNYVGHTSNILNITFHWISAAYFWLQIFNKKLIKERNLVEFLWNNNFSKRNVLIIKSEKNFNLWWTDRCS